MDADVVERVPTRNVYAEVPSSSRTRHSAVFKLERVRPSVVADGLAECRVTWLTVPIVFGVTRQLAQEWTYRFLAAASVTADDEYDGEQAVADLVRAPTLVPASERG